MDCGAYFWGHRIGGVGGWIGRMILPSDMISAEKEKKKSSKEIEKSAGFRVMCCRHNVHELSLEIFNCLKLFGPEFWPWEGGKEEEVKGRGLD